jgi:hypothetical protein
LYYTWSKEFVETGNPRLAGDAFFDHDNHRRYQESLDNLTLADVSFGRNMPSAHSIGCSPVRSFKTSDFIESADIPRPTANRILREVGETKDLNIAEGRTAF